MSFEKEVFKNATGDVRDYVSPNASQDVGFGLEAYPEDFSDLFGLGKKAQQRKKTRLESKNKAREIRAQAKLTEAEAKKETAKASQISAAGDSSIASALATNQPTASSTGLSTGAKIGIGVGALLIVGTGVYFMFFHKKK